MYGSNKLIQFYSYSDLTDKMKRSFFPAAVVSKLLYGCTLLVLTRHMEEKTWQLQKKAASNIEQVLEAASHKAATLQPLTTHHENYSS